MAVLFAGLWRRAGVLTDAELTDVRYSGAAVQPLWTLKVAYYGTVCNAVVLEMVMVAAVHIAEVFAPAPLAARGVARRRRPPRGAGPAAGGGRRQPCRGSGRVLPARSRRRGRRDARAAVPSSAWRVPRARRARAAAGGAGLDDRHALNWGASDWSHDLYGRLWCCAWRGHDADPRRLVTVACLSKLLLVALSLVVMTHFDPFSRLGYTSLLTGAGLGSGLIVRRVWEHANASAELAGIASSALLAPLLLASPLEEWTRLATMAAISMTSTVAAAWWLPATEAETLDRFYRRVRPAGVVAAVREARAKRRRRRWPALRWRWPAPDAARHGCFSRWWGWGAWSCPPRVDPASLPWRSSAPRRC